jgi:hypothetical protein
VAEVPTPAVKPVRDPEGSIARLREPDVDREGSGTLEESGEGLILAEERIRV